MRSMCQSSNILGMFCHRKVVSGKKVVGVEIMIKEIRENVQIK